MYVVPLSPFFSTCTRSELKIVCVGRLAPCYHRPKLSTHCNQRSRRIQKCYEGQQLDELRIIMYISCKHGHQFPFRHRMFCKAFYVVAGVANRNSRGQTCLVVSILQDVENLEKVNDKKVLGTKTHTSLLVPDNLFRRDSTVFA